jgi:hypothetical protein
MRRSVRLALGIVVCGCLVGCSSMTDRLAVMTHKMDVIHAQLLAINANTLTMRVQMMQQPALPPPCSTQFPCQAPEAVPPLVTLPSLPKE